MQAGFVFSGWVVLRSLSAKGGKPPYFPDYITAQCGEGILFVLRNRWRKNAERFFR